MTEIISDEMAACLTTIQTMCDALGAAYLDTEKGGLTPAGRAAIAAYRAAKAVDPVLAAAIRTTKDLVNHETPVGSTQADLPATDPSPKPVIVDGVDEYRTVGGWKARRAPDLFGPHCFIHAYGFGRAVEHTADGFPAKVERRETPYRIIGPWVEPDAQKAETYPGQHAIEVQRDAMSKAKADWLRQKAALDLMAAEGQAWDAHADDCHQEAGDYAAKAGDNPSPVPPRPAGLSPEMPGWHLVRSTGGVEEVVWLCGPTADGKRIMGHAKGHNDWETWTPDCVIRPWREPAKASCTILLVQVGDDPPYLEIAGHELGAAKILGRREITITEGEGLKE